MINGKLGVVHKGVAVVLLGCFLAGGPARAQEENAVEPAPAQPAAVLPAIPPLPPPPPPSPALDVSSPAQQPPASRPSLFRRWWFWTAVGAVAAGTVAVIIISSHGHAPPATDLGNQEFQP
jgi:hypothetical protein